MNGTAPGGVSADVTVHFSTVTPRNYSVRFVETGLAAGTKRQVPIDGFTRNSTGTKVTFSIENGTYTVSVDFPGGSYYTYGANPFTVEGATVVVPVNLSDPNARPRSTARI
jgi:hypothetical protein